MSGKLHYLVLLPLLFLCTLSGARDREKISRYDNSARPVFVAKGQWMAGGHASFSGHDNDNYTFAIVKNINSVGFHVSVFPEACYFISDNLGVGAKFGYGRMMLDAKSANAELGSLSLSIKDYYSVSQDFTMVAFMRYYIPVGDSRRLAFHVDAGVLGTVGQARNSDGHTGAEVGSWEKNHSLGLALTPGLTVKMSPRSVLFASVGMAGLQYGRKNQIHNQVDNGSSNSFSISYMLDLTSLSIGVDIILGKR